MAAKLDSYLQQMNTQTEANTQSAMMIAKTAAENSQQISALQQMTSHLQQSLTNVIMYINSQVQQNAQQPDASYQYDAATTVPAEQPPTQQPPPQALRLCTPVHSR